jgi:hypothetical protein
VDRIMASSICIPCDMPYVNNIWMPRSRTDRPPVVPEGATNLGLIGQYVEVPQDIAFTVEYSARTAWEAVHLLLKRGPAPPPLLSGPIRSKGAARRAESVCLSVTTLGRFAQLWPDHSSRAETTGAMPRSVRYSAAACKLPVKSSRDVRRGSTNRGRPATPSCETPVERVCASSWLMHCSRSRRSRQRRPCCGRALRWFPRSSPGVER